MRARAMLLSMAKQRVLRAEMTGPGEMMSTSTSAGPILSRTGRSLAHAGVHESCKREKMEGRQRFAGANDMRASSVQYSVWAR